MANGWTRVGTLKKKKDGSGHYFQIDSDVSLKKGEFLVVQNPRKRKGISEEDAAKIPDFVVAEFSKGPPRDNS